MSIETITVTVDQLSEIIQCCRRMTKYADVKDSLLITTVSCKKGTQIRLILDKSCITNEQRYPRLDSS